MYTDDAVSTGGDDASVDVFSQECADDPHPVYHEVHDKCPVTREPDMFGGEQRHAVDVRRRALGAEAPRGLLVEGRRQHRQRRAADPAVGRPARPRASTGACSTRSSRRSG